jgi:TfoX/Sxy family transcriptional regulator of competence genes
MATWQKPEPALVRRFLASLPMDDEVQRRQMFGCPCAFVNGNMFAGLHEQKLIVRLPAQASSRPFEVMGKVMKEYAAIEDALDCPPSQFSDWIMRALAYTRTLPTKERKIKAQRQLKPKVAPKRKPQASAGKS